MEENKAPINNEETSFAVPAKPTKPQPQDTVPETPTASNPAAPAQEQPAGPTGEEKKAAAEAARKAQRQKARRRRRRALRNLLIRLLLLVVIIYVLFFQIIGVTTMPSDDMYPRIDAGDLTVFYRLDKDVRAQDIIVFTKDISTLQDYTERADHAGEEETESPTAAPQPTATQRPVPQVADNAPAKIVDDGTLLGKINHFVYDAGEFLGIRREAGKQMFICRVVAAAGDTVEITEAGSLVINGNTMIESNIFSQTTPYVGFVEYPLTLKAGECFVLADRRNGGADSRFFGPVYTEDILGTVITIARRNNL